MRYSKEAIKEICGNLIDNLTTPALKIILTNFSNLLYDELEHIDNDSNLDKKPFYNV